MARAAAYAQRRCVREVVVAAEHATVPRFADAPRLPRGEPDVRVHTGVHDRVEYADGEARAEMAHHEALDRPGPGPLLGEQEAGAAPGDGPGPRRWYLLTLLIMGSVSGCSDASFCMRSGTSSPLRTRRQKRAGIDMRKGRTIRSTLRTNQLSSGFDASGRIWVSSRTKRRGWRVSSPISCRR
jgi:hypothetical protein